jgi:SAM-dependent methyltransferase
MASDAIPLPPPEMRPWVGPIDPADYDNPGGTPILDAFGVALEAYDTVFDFGCGCGRQARQLLQQTPRPRRYVGIDVHPGLVGWCRDNLTPVDPAFQFAHHDVYSPRYAPGNSLQLARPFPVEDAAVTLIIATSVFTHLSKDQVEYYLSEVARILAPNGVAYTSWFFFDRAGFPVVPEVACLYTSEQDFAQAVLFDREWFLATVRSLGLAVRQTLPPQLPGYQWTVMLEKRTPASVDRFPLGMDGAEWVSGATLKARAIPALTPEMAAKHHETRHPEVARQPPVPRLFGALAELDQLKRSNAWAIGRALTAPVRMLKALFR